MPVYKITVMTNNWIYINYLYNIYIYIYIYIYVYYGMRTMKLERCCDAVIARLLMLIWQIVPWVN